MGVRSCGVQFRVKRNSSHGDNFHLGAIHRIVTASQSPVNPSPLALSPRLPGQTYSSTVHSHDCRLCIIEGAAEFFRMTKVYGLHEMWFCFIRAGPGWAGQARVGWSDSFLVQINSPPIKSQTHSLIRQIRESVGLSHCSSYRIVQSSQNYKG